MANLADCIRIEIAADHLSDSFTASMLRNLYPLPGDKCRIGGKVYAASAIASTLANLSVGPRDRKGKGVKRGSPSLFLKQGKGRDGLYTLIDNDPVDDDEDGPAAVEMNTTSPQASRPKARRTGRPVGGSVGDIAADYVTCLREKPFRIRDNRTGWHPEEGAVFGWQARVDSYRWNGSNWQSNQDTIQAIVDELASVQEMWLQTREGPDYRQVESLYERIRLWGNPSGTQRFGRYVAERLTELWSPEGEITEVDSTLTKLYAFGDPNNFVIYDSRVATAILSIAEDLYRHKTIDRKRQETVDSQFSRVFPFLGRYQGVGGTRPRGFRWDGWPNAYKVVAAQYDANRLCQAIADHLNAILKEDRCNWTLREVESVLFMEGY